MKDGDCGDMGRALSVTKIVISINLHFWMAHQSDRQPVGCQHIWPTRKHCRAFVFPLGGDLSKMIGTIYFQNAQGTLNKQTQPSM